ncbi:TetR family transcriptional regulator [Streptomyces antibioticus]|nr:TetR family transcriptional regulator [Streptomyces antibioticus]
MVRAATELMRERGYNATVFAEVLRRADAPRGSVYFHFPGGKAQLAVEAAEAHAHGLIGVIDQVAAETDSASAFVARYVDVGRDEMVASGYARGCGIAPLVIEGAAQDVEEAKDVGRRAYGRVIDRVAYHLVEFGVAPSAAQSLSDAILAGVEGAMITARALHSPSPFESMRDVLVQRAAGVSPKAPRR